MGRVQQQQSHDGAFFSGSHSKHESIPPELELELEPYSSELELELAQSEQSSEPKNGPREILEKSSSSSSATGTHSPSRQAKKSELLEEEEEERKEHSWHSPSQGPETIFCLEWSKSDNSMQYGKIEPHFTLSIN